MNNKKALWFFENMTTSDTIDKFSIKLNNDFTDYDAELIKDFYKKGTLLDLGSGSGILLSKIKTLFSKIVAVEKFKRFSDFIDKDNNIIVVNQNILDFTTTDVFDTITMFGIMHYFNNIEAEFIYKKYYNNLKKRGS